MTLQGRTALVTGATGFLGGALARRLAADGVQVKALARNPEKGRSLRDVSNVEIVLGDITDTERMQAVTQGCDYVFHVAAALGGKLAGQQRVNVDGTGNVMRAAAAAGVQRVVHVSSIAVYGYRTTSDAIAEDTPQQPGRVPYNLTKSRGETVVREIGQEQHVPYAIIRPAMIYGPRSGMWTKTMFQVAKRQPTPFLGDGSGHAHPIYVDDVVDMMIVLATHPQAENQAFNCAPDPAPTWREFLSRYSRLAGHDRWLALPAWPIRLAAPLAEAVMTIRGEPQEVPALIPFVMSHKTYKMTKAQEMLGWQPQVSLEDGIQRCVPWLRERRLLS